MLLKLNIIFTENAAKIPGNMFTVRVKIHNVQTGDMLGVAYTPPVHVVFKEAAAAIRKHKWLIQLRVIFLWC